MRSAPHRRVRPRRQTQLHDAPAPATAAMPVMPAAATAAANQTAAGAATVSRDPAWPATTTYYDAAPSPAPPALQGPLTAFESFLLLIGGGLFEGLYDLVS